MSRVCCSEAREQLCTEHVPLFASLPYDTQKYLADRAHHARYERGTLLFAEGDVADAVRVVHEGTVKLRQTDADGRETIVELLTPGRTAGEDLFLDAGVYPYDGVCMTDVNLCEIRSGVFLDFRRLFPDAAASLIAQLSRRLREVRELNRLLTENDAARRLAGFLSAQDRRLCGRTIALTIDD
ncbi:MAG: Crp/Fnr family transcriptional regulator, partial [Pyramidobacter sp.]|nr:Crp/Fnr family transcriptional regulator [Pyramidobacter sp.]